MMKTEPCCYCCRPTQGEYSIHRDGFGEGPEIDLCNACAENDNITCEMIWERNAARSETDRETGA